MQRRFMQKRKKTSGSKKHQARRLTKRTTERSARATLRSSVGLSATAAGINVVTAIINVLSKML
jgi:hypothetical protein